MSSIVTKTLFNHLSYKCHVNSLYKHHVSINAPNQSQHLSLDDLLEGPKLLILKK